MISSMEIDRPSTVFQQLQVHDQQALEIGVRMVTVRQAAKTQPIAPSLVLR